MASNLAILKDIFVSHFNALQYFSILIGATFKGKNMLPKGPYSFF